MPKGENWLDNLPVRYKEGQNGFELRLARELAAVGVRCYTLESLANGPTTIPPAIPIFVDWLEHLDQKIPGPETRHREVIRVGLIRNLIDPAAKRNRGAIEALFAQLARTNPPLPHIHEYFTLRALDTIAERKDYDRMVRIFRTLTHDDSKICVLHYLGQFKTPEARELILPHVADPLVRYQAIQSLGRIKNPADRALIESYADDPNYQVRNAVKSALKKIPQS
ncbi:HEAT repeat domain-containing protein [Antrihabitans sp. YC3-6]|uniref:HEAT repeat domain-containing protein n=1 Tax=Antrihabitans stalagmiti TaxID=2799499 RepID=A0A934U242_9NOCA|nr:HEAT repeat domain-containing protein [Antrihabitans stalagmiti]MBJ8338745.1 HEAT repeat domain-containing protein [Antrihabitans stalagmiti]